VADDVADVRAVVDDYLQLEGTDLSAQQDLMTDDSIFINLGRRQMNQAHNSMVQVAIQEAFGEWDSESRVYATAEDLIVRIYGNAAIASFYRHWDFVPSQKLLDRTNGNPPGTIPPQIVTLVLVKEGRDWKIALRHNSPLHPDN
jgi:ketosteroid isomerase-like protein